jgi:hypothetical protein
MPRRQPDCDCKRLTHAACFNEQSARGRVVLLPKKEDFVKYLERSKKSGYKSVFEEKVDRGFGHYQSHELKMLVGGIDFYLQNEAKPSSCQFYIQQVDEYFESWRQKNPREFAERTGKDKVVVQDFLDEITKIASDCMVQLVPSTHMPPAVEFNRHMSMAANAVQQNIADRNKALKKNALRAESLATKGISAAQYATHSDGVAGLTYAAMTGKGAVAAAALGASATGLGLIAVAGAAALAESGLAIKSALSTHEHLLRLMKIREQLDLYKGKCIELPAPASTSSSQTSIFSKESHRMVEGVLDYVIKQKGQKFDKKVASSIPILGGAGVFCYSATRKVYKIFGGGGGMGVDRHRNAHWLASHLCRCNCALAEEIVSALYSVAEMRWLQMNCEYEVIAGCLADKMKSV